MPGGSLSPSYPPCASVHTVLISRTLLLDAAHPQHIGWGCMVCGPPLPATFARCMAPAARGSHPQRTRWMALTALTSTLLAALSALSRPCPSLTWFPGSGHWQARAK
mmetsp:Transcript_20020/g.35730  ORF Transcript_20020/g.35730 Transcript_20020/m.35730 type:complete len:107 (+) Transcript_20020:1530-1850(+)